MLGLLDLLCLVGTVTGVTVGSVLGFEHFGVWGAVGGGLASLWLCSRLVAFVRLQELILIKRSFRNRSTGSLYAEVVERRCLMLNFTLLELRSRGVDIAPLLLVVLDGLESEDAGNRARGWAALSSAYPEWAENIRDYQPVHGTLTSCREKVGRLRVLLRGTAEFPASDADPGYP
jgi:hypothetical protein